MNNYNIEHIGQQIVDIIISKVKDHFNNGEYLSFRIDDLAKQLKIESNILQESMSELCKNLLKRNIEIHHDNGNWERVSIFISIKYGDNTDLSLELNPEISSYLQYLNRQ
jgi:hypothetical protein